MSGYYDQRAKVQAMIEGLRDGTIHPCEHCGGTGVHTCEFCQASPRPGMCAYCMNEEVPGVIDESRDG